MEQIVIGIVGPCAAGKTTLTENLRALGYNVKHIAQEHSYVPDMWRRTAHPDKLIYLDVSYGISKIRRRLNWTLDEYQKQINRLNHALEHANCYIDTDNLTKGEVLRLAIEYLENSTLDRNKP